MKCVRPLPLLYSDLQTEDVNRKYKPPLSILTPASSSRGPFVPTFSVQEWKSWGLGHSKWAEFQLCSLRHLPKQESQHSAALLLGNSDVSYRHGALSLVTYCIFLVLRFRIANKKEVDNLFISKLPSSAVDREVTHFPPVFP